jgi:nitroreductase
MGFISKERAMGFLELVNKRVSTRTYTAKAVPRDLIEQCLEAARLAPSACNSQPWTFLVADQPNRVKGLCDAALAGIYGMNKFIREAPVLVAVIAERSSYVAKLGGLLRGVEYNRIDIGIACEHFILQAAELGLGTCWLGWFNEKAVVKFLGLPRGTKVDVLISVGWPAESIRRDRRRKALDEIRTYV